MDDTLCRICREKMNAYPMGERDSYHFVACQSCGSVMVSPTPTAEEVDKFFVDIQAEATHVPNHEQLIKKYENTLLKILPDRAGKRFLDIAARQGYGVMAAKAAGLDARGIDSHDFYIRFAKEKYGGDRFEQSTVAQYTDGKKQADVIFSIESFCEQTDLDGFTAALAKILSPGGKLYIEEADGNSFWLPKVFTRWNYADPPLNFVYLSVKGMTALLARHGLRIEKKFFSWGPLMRLVVVKK